jgi:WD40 repeat protein
MRRPLSLALALVIACPITVSAAGNEPPPAKGAAPLVVSTPAWQPVEDEPLPPGAILRLGYARAWHGIEGGLVATADGKNLLAGFGDHVVRVWEADSGKLIAASKPLSGSIDALALAGDGRTVAAAVSNKIHLFDLDKLGETPRTLQGGHQDSISAIAFSSDGKQLLSASHDQKVCLWNVPEGKLVRLEDRQDPNVPYAMMTVAFTRDDRGMFVGGVSKLGLHKTENGELVRSFKGLSRFSNSLHVLPDGKTLAAITLTGTYIWDIDTGELKKHLKEFTGSGAFSTDGRWLAISQISYPADVPIRMYDFKEGKETTPLKGHRSGTKYFVFSADATKLTTYGNDRVLRQWDLAAGKELGTHRGHEHAVTGLAFLAGGSQLVSGSQDGTVRFWNAGNGRELRRLTSTNESFQSLAISPDGKLMALGTAPAPMPRWGWGIADKHFGHLRLWDLAANKERDCFALPGEAACDMQFTPDGAALLIVSYDQARLRDAKTGKERLTLPKADQGLNAAVLSPDGRFIVAATNEPGLRQVGKLAYYDAVNGKESFSRTFVFGGFHAVAYSPDGKRLAVAGSGGGVKGEGGLWLWQSPTDQLVRSFVTNRYDFQKLAYSQDGRLLAAAGPDGVTVFETATGRQRWRFSGGHLKEVACMAFAPNSRQLATGGEDTLIYLWDLTGAYGQARQPPLDESGLDAAWAALADLDGEKAARAITRLVAAPGGTIAYLKKRIGTVSDADRQRIDALIAELDSDIFKVRDRAAKEIERIGEPAVPALKRAVERATSPEVRSKAEQLLKRLGPGDDPAANALARRAVRAIEALEQIGSSEALALLKEIQLNGTSRLLQEESDQAVRRLTQRK